MRDVNKTPLPVEVAPRNSSAPTEDIQTNLTRRRIAKALAIPLVVATALVGKSVLSHVENVIRGPHRSKVHAARAEIKQDPEGKLASIQGDVALNLFGITRKNGRVVVNLATTRRIANLSGDWKVQDARKYFTKNQVPISEDGKVFEADGQKQNFVRIITPKGEVCIAAGQEFQVAGEDRKRIAGMFLMGCALNNEASDLNGDGVVTQEEKFTLADQSARKNIEHIFAPPKAVSQNGFEGLELGARISAFSPK